MNKTLRFASAPLGLCIMLFLSVLAVRSQTFDDTTPLDALRAAAKSGNAAAENELVRRLIKGKARLPEAARILQDAERDINDAFTHFIAEPIQGSATLSVNDIKDLSGIVHRLKRHAEDDWVSGYLLPRLSEQAQILINEEVQQANSTSKNKHDALLRELVQSLNEIITYHELYQQLKFDNVSLRPETTNLMEQAKHPSFGNKATLNRLLLEDTYPLQLAKMPPIEDTSTYSKLRKQYQQQQDRYDKLKASVEDKELKEALQLCEAAVKQDNVGSMLLLAFWSLNGIGMPTNCDRAIDLNKKAAALGEPAAMQNLGIYYANGTYVRKDMNEAVNWFEKAIAKGSYTAHVLLADILLDGGINGTNDGYPKSSRRAYALGRGLQLACEEGSTGYMGCGRR
jgi:hypothetical protein